MARTRWLCPGGGQVVRPSSQVQAARCKQVQTAEECFTGSGRIVGGQSPPCLPRSAASAGNFPEWLWALLAQTRWSDRPRPSLPQIPAPGWHSTSSTSSANVRRCTTAGRGQRTGGLQQQQGPALQQRATSCHLRQQTTSGPAADSCRLIAGEYLRATGEQTHLRVCCYPGKVCTRGV